MQTYWVKGTTIKGDMIEESIEAPNEKEALRTIYKTYGKLRRPFDIYTSEQLENLESYPKISIAPINPLLSTQEILDIVVRIHDNQVTTEEYSLLSSFFMRMIKTAVRELWNDIIIETREEKELEIFNDIVLKFIPSYDQNRNMALTTFIKKKIRGRLIDNWKAEKYVNSRNGNPRLRYLDEQEYIKRTRIRQEEIDPEVNRETIIEIGQLLDKEERPSKEMRRLFFGRIVSLGLHKEFLKKQIQIRTLELFYGEATFIGKEIAMIQGITQQTANENKLNAERNVLKHIRKNY